MKRNNDSSKSEIDLRYEKEIARIVERLRTHYSPQYVILFGSCARGGISEDSDIDILVVKETTEDFWTRLDTVRMIARPDLPFGPLVLTPNELSNRLDDGDPFMKEIVEKGRRLYGPKFQDSQGMVSKG